jgi:predicted dehydrogenase
MEVWTKMARDVAADPNSPHWQSGVLLNCACHLLDLLLWTCGPVKRVVGSRLQYQPGCGKVDSAVHALLEMENGASILLESLFSPLSGVGLRENGRDEMIELRGDEGLARVQTTLWEQPMIQYPIAERWSEADHAWERYSPGPVDNMEQQYRYIAGALGGSGETCPLATAEEALRLDELMQDIALAAAEDDKVTR